MRLWKLLLILATICFTLGIAWDPSGLIALGCLLLSIWLLMAGAALFTVWHILNRLKWLKWRSPTWFISGPVCLCFAALWVLLGIWVATKPTLLSNEAASSLEKLEYMYLGDQADRYSGRFFWMPWRDKSRLSEVRELVAKSRPDLDSAGMFHAAMVLQHGELPSDYEEAYHLSLAASEAGYEGARSLSEAAYDRWQISIGKPQKYGTQRSVKIGITGVQSN